MCYSLRRAGHENRLIPDSSTVERPAVNRQVLGSNPSRGAIHQTTPKQIQLRVCVPPACNSQAGGSLLTAWDRPPSSLREGHGNHWSFSVARRTMAECVAEAILVGSANSEIATALPCFSTRRSSRAAFTPSGKNRKTCRQPAVQRQCGRTAGDKWLLWPTISA